jgi:hypothetical protein
VLTPFSHLSVTGTKYLYQSRSSFSISELNPFEMANAQEELINKITKELENDAKVKVAAVDIDGVLRGKVMQKSKFFSILKDGFGKLFDC